MGTRGALANPISVEVGRRLIDREIWGATVVHAMRNEALSASFCIATNATGVLTQRDNRRPSARSSRASRATCRPTPKASTTSCTARPTAETRRAMHRGGVQSVERHFVSVTRPARLAERHFSLVLRRARLAERHFSLVLRLVQFVRRLFSLAKRLVQREMRRSRPSERPIQLAESHFRLAESHFRFAESHFRLAESRFQSAGRLCSLAMRLCSLKKRLRALASYASPPGRTRRRPAFAPSTILIGKGAIRSRGKGQIFRPSHATWHSVGKLSRFDDPDA